MLGDPNYGLSVDVWSLGMTVLHLARGRAFVDESSEYGCLIQIFCALGTPTDALWPSGRALPAFSAFPQFRRKTPTFGVEDAEVVSLRARRCASIRASGRRRARWRATGSCARDAGLRSGCARTDAVIALCGAALARCASAVERGELERVDARGGANLDARSAPVPRHRAGRDEPGRVRGAGAPRRGRARTRDAVGLAATVRALPAARRANPPPRRARAALRVRRRRRLLLDDGVLGDGRGERGVRHSAAAGGQVGVDFFHSLFTAGRRPSSWNRSRM